MKKSGFSAKGIAMYGVFTALALVLGYLESLIPLPIGIYGIKLGLSNLVTVTALYLLGGIQAITLNFIRIILSSLLFGNTFSFLYSLCGGMFSVLIMILVKRTNKLGVSGVSICGGIAHNFAQLAVAVFIVDELKIAFYLPVLIAVGALTGFIIGCVSLPVIKQLRNRNSKNAP